MNEEQFDFQSLPQEDEQLDFKNLKPCPNCKKPIPQDATSCYYCGESAGEIKKPAWFIWLAVFVIIAFALLVIF